MIGETIQPFTPATLKVSAKSNPNAVAGAIAAALRQRDGVEVQAVGAAAVNQAVKALAIARAYLKNESLDLVGTPSFISVPIGEEERTGISIAVERRTLDGGAAIE